MTTLPILEKGKQGEKEKKRRRKLEVEKKWKTPALVQLGPHGSSGRK